MKTDFEAQSADCFDPGCCSKDSSCFLARRSIGTLMQKNKFT